MDALHAAQHAQQIRHLFDEALKHPPEERAAYLNQACRDDSTLQRDVEALLAAFDDHDTDVRHFLEHMPLAPYPASDGSPERAEPDVLLGQTISHYRITERLGDGGMGVVYKAYDTTLDRPVALKFLPPELVRNAAAKERFVQEARAASALDHTNIAVIHEIAETEAGQLFIAMSYYEGETLREKIARGPLPSSEALHYAAQIAEGLKRAHEANIIHRDIKPANVIVTEEGVVKIVDFGVAKVRDVSLTKTGATLGTVAYMSPEQAHGEAVDHRTDLWSLGVVLYEMLTGERPFRGDRSEVVIHAIRHDEPTPVRELCPEMPAVLAVVVERLLEKDLATRYQEAEALAADLRMLQEQPEGSMQHATGVPRKRPLWRFRWVVGSFIVVCLILLGYGALRFSNTEQQAERPEQAVGAGDEAGTIQPVSVVLLPLISMTRDAEQEWFTDSMTDALITDLAKIGGLRIISRASAMHYKDTDKTPPEIATELGVEYVIEGSVAKVGEQVKISARLIDAPHDAYLWAETYEQPFRDILGLQGEIARAIAGEIRVELTPQEEALLAVDRQVDPETHEMYLKGMYHLNKYTPEGIELGLRYLHQAVERDPEEPLTHAGLAIGYGIISHMPAPPPDAIEQSRKAMEQALALDENLAEAQLARAMILIYSDWDREGAIQAYDRALKLNPSLALAHAHRGFAILVEGRADEYLSKLSIEERDNEHLFELSQARKLAPLEPIYTAWIAESSAILGRYDEAIEEAQKTLELNPNFPMAWEALAWAYVGKGMYEEAIEAGRKAGASSPDYRWCLGEAYAAAGQRVEALKVAAELESQGKVWDTFGLARIYQALGETDKVFYWLEEMYRQRHPYMQWLQQPGNFGALSGDPRFQDLVRRLNLPERAPSR